MTILLSEINDLSNNFPRLTHELIKESLEEILTIYKTRRPPTPPYLNLGTLMSRPLCSVESKR